MSPHDFSTGLCRGRDTLPLHPIPRNQTMAVYTEELTHLKGAVFEFSFHAIHTIGLKFTIDKRPDL